MKSPGAVVMLWFLLVAGAAGHHGPEEVVTQLSAELVKAPDDAGLLSRRATEYRVLGMHAEAEADLRRVLAIVPGSAADTESLGRVQWAQGKREEALVSVGRAVELAAPGRERAGCLILRSEWEMERGRTREAYAACELAFREDSEGMVDWYLLRSRLQERLGRPADRVRGLKSGQETLGSVVLRNAWVDALLDAGEYQEALPVIELAVALSRLKSSWLIRRGRVRLGTGAADAGREDLAAAVAELDRRIHPERPDAKLLVDRGWARVLLGDRDAARRDLELARKHGADRWDVERLAAAIRRPVKPA